MKSTIKLILRLLSKELSAVSFQSPYASFHIRKKVLLSDLFLGKLLSPLRNYMPCPRNVLHFYPGIPAASISVTQVYVYVFLKWLLTSHTRWEL